MAPMILLALSSACAPVTTSPQAAPTSEPAQPVPIAVPVPPPVVTASPEATAEPRCASDDDCGYDPPLDRCVADPRANRQPPLVDQGVVCYCERSRCATLRVLPVPCESDASCTVGTDPRPHPIAASRSGSRPQKEPCRDSVLTATCERTNICTLRRVRCPRR